VIEQASSGEEDGEKECLQTATLHEVGQKLLGSKGRKVEDFHLTVQSCKGPSKRGKGRGGKMSRKGNGEGKRADQTWRTHRTSETRLPNTGGQNHSTKRIGPGGGAGKEERLLEGGGYPARKF